MSMPSLLWFLIVILVLLSAQPEMRGQSMSPCALTREYIYLDGRLVALDTPLFRCQDWEYPAGYGGQSQIVNPQYAVDDDTSTAADMQIDSTSSSAGDYSQLFVYGFAQPDPTRTLDHIQISMVMSYDRGSNPPGNNPGVEIDILKSYTNALAGFYYYSAVYANLAGHGGGASLATATYTVNIPAADFASAFGGQASNIGVRAVQWNSNWYTFNPEIHTYVYAVTQTIVYTSGP